MLIGGDDDLDTKLKRTLGDFLVYMRGTGRLGHSVDCIIIM